MKLKRTEYHAYFAAVVFAFGCLPLGGCLTAMSSRQFIPQSAKNLDSSELAHIHLSNTDLGVYSPRNIALNGKILESDSIYLMPGEYVLQYNILETTESWKIFQEYVATDDFKYRYGDLYCRGKLIEISEAPTAIQLGVCEMFDGEKTKPRNKSRVLNLKAGQTYYVSEW